MEASEEKQAPVILAIHPDEALSCGLRSFVRRSRKRIGPRSPSASIWITVRPLAQVMQAIQCGFTSVMIDASAPARREHPHLQGDRGAGPCRRRFGRRRVGNHRHDRPRSRGGPDRRHHLHHDPDDVVTFVDATGVDSLAVAIGTSHGIYPKDKKPELKFDLLKRSPLGWTSRWSPWRVRQPGRGDRRGCEAGRQQDQHLQRRQGRPSTRSAARC